MNVSKLDILVLNGMITAYKLIDLNEDGEEVKNPKGFRNTQQLELTFPNGSKLLIDSFCSGSSEDTVLLIS